MDLLELYQYFSLFVPVEVLRRNHIGGSTPDTGAEQVQADVLALESKRRIESIGDFLFLGDQDFVLDRLKNSKDQLLFVDSDRLDFEPSTDEGVRLSVGITVAEHYTRKNADVVSELTVQNRCLETLKVILRVINADSEAHCPACLRVTRPAEIRFFDAKALDGLIGYTAFLTLAGSDYKRAAFPTSLPDYSPVPQPERGADGLSAYEIAVKHGFEGTEEEWLQSLKGEQGPQGEPGEQGPQGEPGAGGSSYVKEVVADYTIRQNRLIKPGQHKVFFANTGSLMRSFFQINIRNQKRDGESWDVLVNGYDYTTDDLLVPILFVPKAWWVLVTVKWRLDEQTPCKYVWYTGNGWEQWQRAHDMEGRADAYIQHHLLKFRYLPDIPEEAKETAKVNIYVCPEVHWFWQYLGITEAPEEENENEEFSETEASEDEKPRVFCGLLRYEDMDRITCERLPKHCRVRVLRNQRWLSVTDGMARTDGCWATSRPAIKPIDMVQSVVRQVKDDYVHDADNYKDILEEVAERTGMMLLCTRFAKSKRSMSRFRVWRPMDNYGEVKAYGSNFILLDAGKSRFRPVPEHTRRWIRAPRVGGYMLRKFVHRAPNNDVVNFKIHAIDPAKYRIIFNNTRGSQHRNCGESYEDEDE